jgi:hypothetical protein
MDKGTENQAPIEHVPVIVFDAQSSEGKSKDGYGFIPITLRAARRILQRMEIADVHYAHDREFFQIEYLDKSSAFFAKPFEKAFLTRADFERFSALLAPISKERFGLITDGTLSVPEALVQPMQFTSQVIVSLGRDQRVRWTASKKKSREVISGATVPRDIIEACARR